jgi:hypothetical protein
LQVDHPAGWELAIACGVDEPRRCVFADRYYHRLDVSWRPLKFEPNLDLVLQKYRRREKKQTDTVVKELTGLSEWRGVVQKLSHGTVVNAVCFLSNAHWLVDVTITWPKSRDVDLEKAILKSIKAEDPGTSPRFWQAMGISLSLGSEFDLVLSQAKVGQVKWDFATEARRGPKLAVERIALPEYWLKGTLREWLAGQLRPGSKLLRQDQATVNNHRGEQMLSRRKLGPVTAARGFAELRLDVAWLCPVESRMYHVSNTDVARAADTSLPRDLSIRCCRPAPAAMKR